MTERSIPDPSLSDLATLLGVEEATTPAAKSALADALADALVGSQPTGADLDAAGLAAHLEGGLSESERERMLDTLAHDPGALAELESAQALLERVQAAPQPRSAVRIAAARAILEDAQPAPPERVSWLSRLGLGSPRRAVPAIGVLALASICAILVAPALFGSGPQGPAPSVPVSAFSERGPDSAAGGWSGAASDAGHAGGWVAMALSRSDQRFGAAKGGASKTEAREAALAACRQAGGMDCKVDATIEGQCLSTAAASPQPPITRPGPDAESASKSALTMCHDQICRTVKTLCAQP